ncbi:MAG TPA: dehydrogenase [Actinobacteria bacterium]|nr:dehydrogenase [Actinomycetota bacterium]
MANLRAGLIGLGVMGSHHLRVLRSMEGVDLVGVVDPYHAFSQGTYSSVRELIDEGVDYCVVAAPTALHEEVALELADARVHALVEKPLTDRAESAVRVAEAFSRAGLIGAVGHVERYNPALQSMRQRIRGGDLGTVFQVTTRRQGPFPARIADVGVVKDLATHDLDLTSWILDSPYQSVFARMGHRAGREHEDLVSVVADLREGVIANHLVNWVSPFKERITIVNGERGSLVADTLSADITFYENGSTPTQWDGVANFRGVLEGDVIRYAISKPEPLRLEHEAFRDAVLGLPADIVTMDHGVMVTQVAEAILQSASTGTAVSL